MTGKREKHRRGILNQKQKGNSTYEKESLVMSKKDTKGCIAILKEMQPGEARVALTPPVIKSLIQKGYTVNVEKGAGEKAGFADELYAQAEANLTANPKKTLKNSTLLISINPPQEDILSQLEKDTSLISLISPTFHKDACKTLSERKIETYALEQIPRISRAQSMDVLSSQANLAGYRAVVEALNLYDRAFPMMTTAAGSVPPAKVFIMGTGVAGLQAIATAKRMGALVSATDVRPSTKEQVQSLGARFVAVEDEEFLQAQTETGYAKPMSEAYKIKQAELIRSTLTEQDVVVTTALIPGKPAPVLITKDMVQLMKPGAIIVDMAAANGGNCEVTTPGKTIAHHGVSIIGADNLPAKVAHTASLMFARNIEKFLELFDEIKDKNTPQAARELAQSIITSSILIAKEKITKRKKAATTKKASTKTDKTKKSATSKKTKTPSANTPSAKTPSKKG